MAKLRRSRRLDVVLALLLLLPAIAAKAAEDAWDDSWGDDWDEEPGGLVWTGFLELGAGVRLDDDEPTRATLGELRGRTETEWAAERWTASLKVDALRDEALNDSAIDLRELALQFPVGSALDVKAGRQVLTWGTGDLLFLNDLFPKDFESFFAGREDEYLKAPSTAVRLTAYTDLVNVDLVWTPEFEPDIYLDGERFTFFNPAVGDIDVFDPPLSVDRPEGLHSGEVALRLFKRVRSTELALYAYHGYFKQPTALNRRGRATFAPMEAAGFSIRGPLGAGIANAEGSWYESRDDGNGDNPNVPNSQARWLLGYERELIPNLTGAVQYYGERLDDPALLRAGLPDPRFAPDKWRSLFTLRLSYRALRDNLTLGLFTFYSPSDDDYHLRPTVSYRFSDAWQISGGASLFGGSKVHTTFGQLQDNDNVYLRLRRYY
ncbi:MAG: hypothetical protein RIC56_08120 [Pseudomonadales bacterium]